VGHTNTVRGCRFWWNTDDGIDLIDNRGVVKVESCWSWYNGYVPGTFQTGGNGNGFKLGGGTEAYPSTVLREVTSCVSANNRANGFDHNGSDFIIKLFNSTAYNNGDAGFTFESSIAHVLRNNVACNNVHDAWTGQSNIHDHNTWDSSVSVSTADFAGIDLSLLANARQSDGSLPVITTLHLASGSDLIDAGVGVGLPYLGSNPDLGAFERQ
jgi:hypothetical protein